MQDEMCVGDAESAAIYCLHFNTDEPQHHVTYFYISDVSRYILLLVNVRKTASILLKTQTYKAKS